MPVVDPRGRQGRTPLLCPNSFIFIQFSAKILQNNRLPHLPRELAPPLGNPGSATGFESQAFQDSPKCVSTKYSGPVLSLLEQNAQAFLEMRHGEKFNVLLPLNRLRNKNEDIEKSGRIQTQCEEG